ncbi:hypothetical protein C8J56DRAFT_931771 [Mycena floridula]|nr:hypothetical protein C8J56DRAFT_931771 [Mycena floridula]
MEEWILLLLFRMKLVSAREIISLPHIPVFSRAIQQGRFAPRKTCLETMKASTKRNRGEPLPFVLPHSSQSEASRPSFCEILIAPQTRSIARCRRWTAEATLDSRGVEERVRM